MAAAMLTVVLVLVPHDLEASEGPDDIYGYHWVDSKGAEPLVGFKWIEISYTGTDVGFDQDRYSYEGPFAIGFDFEFYGVAYTEFYVTANGVVELGTPYATTNQPIPLDDSVDNIIAPFWGEFYVYYPPYNYGAVHYETIGTTPNQQLIVQWSDVSYYGSYSIMTFQAILNETGEIWFNYLEMSGRTGSGETVGIEAPDGSDGCLYSYNSPAIEDNLAIMFDDGPVAFGPDQTMEGYFEDDLTYPLNVRNNQAITDSFDIEYTTDLGWTVALYDGTWTALGDNNGNTIPDTGNLDPGEEFLMWAVVTIPLDPTAQNETVVLSATSYTDPAVKDNATLIAQAPQARYHPPFTDYGVDADTDTDFDTLVVSVAFDVFSDGMLGVYGELYTDTMEFVDLTFVYTWVPAGYSTVDLAFSGEEVFSSRHDGTFVALLQMWGRDSPPPFYDSSHTTGSYTHDQFDPPAAMFLPPYEEYLPDGDEDLLYDALIVNASIEVFEPGEYTVEAQLDTGLDLFDDSETDTYAAGVYDLSFEFSAWAIRKSGADGPYTVDLSLLDNIGAEVDDDTFDTAAHLYTDFETAPAYFSPPHGDAAVDTDDDGYYNCVVVTINIGCSDTGFYGLRIEVYDPYDDAFDLIEEILYLEAGTVVPYQVNLSARDIRTNGVSGTFDLDMSLFDPSTSVEYDSDYYTTAYYSVSAFDRLGAFFVTPHSNEAVDLDDDTYYDLVLVTIFVNASSTGLYDITARLYDPYSTERGTFEFQLLLLENEQVGLEIEISASLIQNLGISGSWYVWLQLSDHFTSYVYDTENYWTSYYYVSDFEPPLITFDSPHEDYSVDLDGDSYYDLLVIRANILVYVQGTYTVTAVLYTPWATVLAEQTLTEVMTGSYHQMEFEFAGWLIYSLGSYSSLRVNLIAQTLDSEIVDIDNHYTSTLYYYLFEEYPAAFYPPHDSLGVDQDGDLLYDYLVVSASVEVVESGYFVVRGVLIDEDGSWTDTEENVTYLSVGIGVVELWFSAWSISLAQYDPYYVILYLEDPEGNLMDSEYYWVTGMYSYTDFATSVHSIESGWAYNSPVIDGAMSPNEWFGAETVYLMAADNMNDVNGTVYVMNDETYLFICIDATGDATESVFDSASVAFDTDNDNATTDWHDDQFMVVSTSEGSATYHSRYNPGLLDWDLDCLPFDPLLPWHEGLEGASGFNGSYGTTTGHRIYEFCIPLELLQAAPGDTLGFAVVGETTPGVWDEDAGAYSTWPAYFPDPPSLRAYADLLLSFERPLTTVVLDGTEGDNGWFVSGVEVTMSGSGGAGGVDGIFYRLDAGAWQEYSAPFTVSTDGRHLLEFYSSDASGSDERIRSIAVHVDTEIPATQVVVQGLEGDNGWLREHALLEFALTDNVSGALGTWYRLDGGEWTAVSGNRLLVDEDGEHVVEYYTVDFAGNEEAVKSVEFKADTELPRTIHAIDGSTVSLSADDNTSGIGQTYFRIDDGEWQVYLSPFEVRGKGSHFVDYYSVDVAGNVEAEHRIQVEGATSFFSSSDLLIVLLILGLIVAVAIPLIYGIRRKARMADSRAVFKDSVGAVAQLEDDTSGGWPGQEGAPPGEGSEPEAPPESPENESRKDE